MPVFLSFFKMSVKSYVLKNLGSDTKLKIVSCGFIPIANHFLDFQSYRFLCSGDVNARLRIAVSLPDICLKDKLKVFFFFFSVRGYSVCSRCAKKQKPLRIPAALRACGRER